MAFSFNVNLSPLTGAVAMYELKQQMKSAGWTVTSSGDASTYNASGDLITTGSSGASGLANTNAWFVIQSPSVDGYQRAFTFQRGGANTQWRVKYSHLGAFSGGSPGASQTPSATDEQILLGGGTDGSPSFGTLYSTDNSYRYHIITGETDENYVVYAVAIPNGGGTPNSLFYFDRLASNSFAPEDADPYVILVTTSAPTTANLSNSSIGPFAWYRKELSGQSFVRTTTALYLDSSGTALIAGGGSNSWNGQDDGIPIIYGRTANLGGNTGLKGISKFLYWKVANRTTADTLSVSTSKDKIIFSDIIFPWNGSNPTI